MRAKTLGKLEHLVMEILWKNNQAAVRDILLKIKKNRPIAYTTVATILQRLFDKGLVGRKTEKKGYQYYPKVSKESYVTLLTKSFVKKLEQSFGSLAINSFAGSIEDLPKEKKQYLLKILSSYESKH